MQEFKNLDELTVKLKERWQQTFSGAVDAKWKPVVFSFGIKKESFYIALGVFWGVILLFLIGIGLSWYQNHQLNQQLNQLQNLSTYHLPNFTASNKILEDVKEMPNSFSSAMTFHKETQDYKNLLDADLNFKRSVYSDFLRNMLLPSLNIWKNPYTQEIDLTILGKKYLDQNPYQDIALLSQWSSIIRDSGKDIGANEVTNMQIWDIVEENGLFHIPISIAFKSDSKRAFLLLVDKLSQTSSISNIGLINDFTHQLFQTIREEKGEELKKIAENYHLTKAETIDERTFDNQLIARYLYDAMIADVVEGNLLIDDALVQKLVKKTVLCTEQESMESCYFRFRDKYRSLPALAYSVGVQGNLNKAALIKQFYAEIPPLIAIQSFTFDKAKAQGISFAEEGAYVGNVNFNIYGRTLAAKESQEISKLLETSCFGSGTEIEMTPEWALKKVEERIHMLGSATEQSDAKVALLTELLELKDVLTETQKDFASLSAYHQIIKKFEIYRSLKNSSLCI